MWENVSVSVIISATASIFRSRIWKETQSCGEKAQILLHQKIVHIFFLLSALWTKSSVHCRVIVPSLLQQRAAKSSHKSLCS